MKKAFPKLILLSATLLPFIASAQASGSKCGNNIQDLASFLGLFTCYISSIIIPLLFAVAIMVFIWGVVQFIANADNEEKRTQGRDFMVYGIVALFVMVSIWGLVNVLSNTFGVKTFIPQLQTQ